MEYKFQYKDNEEREQVKNNHTDLFLKEDAITLEGNFLTFSDVKPLDYQLQDIKNNTDIIILKQEGII